MVSDLYRRVAALRDVLTGVVFCIGCGGRQQWYMFQYAVLNPVQAFFLPLQVTELEMDPLLAIAPDNWPQAANQDALWAWSFQPGTMELKDVFEGRAGEDIGVCMGSVSKAPGTIISYHMRQEFLPILSAAEHDHHVKCSSSVRAGSASSASPDTHAEHPWLRAMVAGQSGPSFADTSKANRGPALPHSGAGSGQEAEPDEQYTSLIAGLEEQRQQLAVCPPAGLLCAFSSDFAGGAPGSRGGQIGLSMVCELVFGRGLPQLSSAMRSHYRRVQASSRTFTGKELEAVWCSCGCIGCAIWHSAGRPIAGLPHSLWGRWHHMGCPKSVLQCCRA